MPDPPGQSALIPRVVEAVAAATDTSPLDLPPLYDTVDPDALAQTVASADDEFRMTFDFAGAEVVIAGTGEIVSATPRSSLAPADAGEESSGIAFD
jgi:hypothetical protein